MMLAAATPSPPSRDLLEGPTPSGLRWLIGLRLAILFVFLGTATALQERGALPVSSLPLFALLGITFGLSVLYLVWLRGVRNLRRFCQVQIALDLLIQTALVHVTGGLESALSPLYIFSIVAAAALLDRRNTLLTASAGSIFYGGLINLYLYGGGALGWPPAGPGSGRPPSVAFYQVFVNIVAFFVVAILSSQLAERLREAGQRLQERTLDLRKLQTLHRDIIANIPSGVATLDMEGRIVSFNEAAERITGCPAPGLRDRPWTESPLVSCPAISAFFANPGAAAPNHVIVEDIRRPDGRLMPLGIGVSPLRDEGGAILGLVVIFQDLTERRRMEEQLRRADRLAALGQLAAGIAHEIRNPLAAISGCVQMLQAEATPSARPQRLLDIVVRETDRLKLITGQFLDFARARPGGPQPCPLGPILEEVVALLSRSQDRHPDTEVELEAATLDELGVLADPDQLKQIFWNLSLNAFEAMPGGGRLVIRAFARREGDDPWGIVEFADAGGGIPAEVLERIFDPFYTTKENGTGLGLYIARKIAEGFGGTITVENRAGLGATFRVVLPLAPLGQEAAAHAAVA